MQANGCVFPVRFPARAAGVRVILWRADADNISYIRIAGRTHEGTGTDPESHSSTDSGMTPNALAKQLFERPAISIRTRSI
jgi:hypothetical protein